LFLLGCTVLLREALFAFKSIFAFHHKRGLRTLRLAEAKLCHKAGSLLCGSKKFNRLFLPKAIFACFDKDKIIFRRQKNISPEPPYPTRSKLPLI